MTLRKKLILSALGLLVVSALALVAISAPADGLERGAASQFFGRFHPLVVHFPIALLLLVAALECVGFFRGAEHLQVSAGFVLGLAAGSSVVAILLGWLLARSGGYEGTLVTRHMWGGVALAALLLLCYAARGWNNKIYAAGLFAALCLMAWTSDQGGKITHGENFLTEYMPPALRSVFGVAPAQPKPAAVTAKAASSAPLLPASAKASVDFFASRVAPIFEDKCVQCHGPQKHKGKLRLDTFENVMLGGKDGLVVKPGNPKGSELVRRVNLPRDNDDAMPAEGKPGLSAAEIKVIELWIATGAAQTVAAEEVRASPPPPVPIPAPVSLTADYRPRVDKIQALADQLGVRLVPRSQNPHDGLILRTVSSPERCDDTVLAALKPIADLIVDAELARTKITDSGAKTLATFPNLRSLDLSHTAISSRGLAPLGNLPKLESLNLTSTAVDDQAVRPFRRKPGLVHLYLFDTKSSSVEPH